MNTTPVTLLKRIRESGDAEAWDRFVELATPALYAWAHRAGLRHDDAADLVQEVFLLLAVKLPQFQYDPSQSFRGWLRQVTLNKWHERRRLRSPPLVGDEALEEIAEPADEAFWETDYREYLVARAMEIMQAEFEPKTWRACWEHVVSGRTAADVATELGMTPGAVYVAKCRVLARLRHELEGLMD